MGTPRAVGRCPACDAVLEVRRLQCPACQTAVEGRFPPSPYAALVPEQAAFLEVFLRARGNLREVERVLGLSYPTVRGRLDAVLATLGFEGGEPAPEETAREAAAAPGPPAALESQGRRAALDALGRGEISAAEAVERIRRG